MTKVKVKLGRLDDYRTMSVDEDLTIEEALNNAGYKITSTDRLENGAGDLVGPDDYVEDGESYFLVEGVKNS